MTEMRRMPADVLEIEAVAWDAPAREPWHGLLDYYGYHAAPWCMDRFSSSRRLASDFRALRTAWMRPR
jgi:hypothetical protein